MSSQGNDYQLDTSSILIEAVQQEERMSASTDESEQDDESDSSGTDTSSLHISDSLVVCCVTHTDASDTSTMELQEPMIMRSFKTSVLTEIEQEDVTQILKRKLPTAIVCYPEHEACLLKEEDIEGCISNITENTYSVVYISESVLDDLKKTSLTSKGKLCDICIFTLGKPPLVFTLVENGKAGEDDNLYYNSNLARKITELVREKTPLINFSVVSGVLERGKCQPMEELKKFVHKRESELQKLFSHSLDLTENMWSSVVATFLHKHSSREALDARLINQDSKSTVKQTESHSSSGENSHDSAALLKEKVRHLDGIQRKRRILWEKVERLEEELDSLQAVSKGNIGHHEKDEIIEDPTTENLASGCRNSGAMDQGILEMKIRDTEEIFEKTENYVKVHEILMSEGHVTISGASGEGKTSLALMLGEKYRKRGYNLVFVNDVDKFRLHDFIGLGQKIFFIFHDIFGTVGLSTDVPQLKRILHDLQLCLKETSQPQTKRQQEKRKMYVVFTSKSYNLEYGMSKVKDQEMIFFEDRSIIDLTRTESYRYSFKDKKAIFERHKLTHQIEVDIEDVYDDSQGMFGFPLTCKFFFEFHSFHANPKTFFKEPLFYLRRELKSILESRNEQSAALILMLLCDDKMDLSLVEMEFENTPMDGLFRSVKSMIPDVTGTGLANAARNFRGTFFTEGDIIGFFHPTVYDACACALYNIAPTFVLKKCTLKFLYERLETKHVQSTSVNEHNIIYVSDAYNDIIAQRLAQAIENGQYSMSLTHPILKKIEIVDKIFDILQLKETNRFDRLIDTEKSRKTKMLHLKEGGKHLLHWTIHSQSLYLVQKVLAIGCKFSNSEITDAFEACALCGNLSIMSFILSNYKAIRQTNIHQALNVATVGNYVDMVKYLLRVCKDVISAVATHNLLLTAHSNHNKVIKKEIISCICRQENIAISLTSEENVAKEFLHTVCTRGNMKLVKLLLPITDIDCIVDGRTLIMRAASDGNKEIFQLLLTREADLNLTDNIGDSVLHYASRRGETYIVDQLLRFLDINIRGQNGFTPVMIAASTGKKEIFDLLVSKGADLGLTDMHGQTILHHACRSNNTYIMEYLLPIFDINIRGQNGFTPVMIAALSAKKNTFSLLMLKGASLTLTDCCGENVLHHATQGGNIDIVKLILPSTSEEKMVSHR